MGAIIALDRAPLDPFPGRSAARSGALQARDRHKLGISTAELAKTADQRRTVSRCAASGELT